MIAIVDYGLGNLYSIQNMLKHIGAESVITSDVNMIERADKLILPGVGKFDEGMGNLKSSGLDDVLVQQAGEEKPLLGICLGMQLLGKYSEEGTMNGLGLIDFHSKRFDFHRIAGKFKIPHMGWERVKLNETECPLTIGLDDRQRYYFVHSYHAVCSDKDTAIIHCVYGYEFAAGVRNKNVYGVQFHPEKSHRFGMKLLENFVKEC